MIEKSDLRVDWGNEAIEISQKIKGLYPRANTSLRGKNLKILKIKVLRSDEIKNEKYFFQLNYSKIKLIKFLISKVKPIIIKIINTSF